MLWNKIKKHPLVKDKIFFGVNVVNGVLLIAFVATTIARISPRDFAIAGRYTFREELIDFGPWYSAHVFTLFAVLVFVMNLIVARIALRKSKLSSFMILLGTGVVLILNFIVFNVYASNVGF